MENIQVIAEGELVTLLTVLAIYVLCNHHWFTKIGI